MSLSPDIKDYIDLMKAEQREAMTTTLDVLLTNHRGKRNLKDPLGKLPKGLTHDRDWPEFVLTLITTNCVHPDSAPVALMMAWIAPEFPEPNGGSEKWRRAFTMVGYSEDGVRAKLPTETLTLYSGLEGDAVDDPKSWKQMAWTSDIEVARWFSRRFRNDRQLILKAEVEPQYLYAHFTGRNESEYVIDPRKITPVIVEQRHA